MPRILPRLSSNKSDERGERGEGGVKRTKHNDEVGDVAERKQRTLSRSVDELVALLQL
jgi:hypothetical protein